MNGKRLLTRTGVVIGLGMLIFLVLSAVDSPATPIRPDIKKLIQQSQQAQPTFVPARAGWTESSSVTVVRNPVLESITGDHFRSDLRDELASVATPDPWIALSLVTLILLMRKLRSIEAERNRRAVPRIAREIEPPAQQAA
jgi:hypothetical protein